MTTTALSSSSKPGSPPQSIAEPMANKITTAMSPSNFTSDEVSNMDQTIDTNYDMEHTDSAMFAAHYGGVGVNEDSFWDILADSHMKLESYGTQSCDHEMTEPTLGCMPQDPMMPNSISLMAMVPSPVSATNTSSVYEDNTALPSSPLLMHNHSSFSSHFNPSHYITFDSRQDGTLFPLSKPIIREDGFLLVGTEISADSSAVKSEKNRLFVTNFLVSSGSPAHILVEEQFSSNDDIIRTLQEVRDINWIGAQTAVLAIGKDIQLIHLSIGGPCRLQAYVYSTDPINTVHSDTIRELAVSPNRHSQVLSGGFDETVVLTDLRNHGIPQSAAVIGKFNAYDVVSSVRWSPLDSQISWTTDGGDFQVADTRARSPQLQVPLHAFVNVDALGGLFTHEYLSPFNVVLGFERGHMAFVDLRMPRHTSWCVSEKSGVLGRTRLPFLAMAGTTSFEASCLSASVCHDYTFPDRFSMASLNMAASSLEQITLQQPQPLSSYKTSGDFSYEQGIYLAASDNMGSVAVYTDETIFEASTAFNSSSVFW
ncbi:hypothetical protein CCR75_000047 [Bremia lactucae]|uniref:Uncharacterized protein n=1 Tax=Bremia lactucae TaxID=4779 RepID=A0A976IDH3_BRELC|nr:hypothetical protein CCR75_000047 [Bremia lactucae]